MRNIKLSAADDEGVKMQTNPKIIGAGIVIIVVVIALAVLMSRPSSTQTAPSASSTLQTTQQYAVTSTPTTQAPKEASLSLYRSSTAQVNAANGTRIKALGPDGVATIADVLPGTYALVGNSLLSNYNFTIATFTINNASTGSPPNEPNTTAAYGFAYEVNGQISASISFVNATGKPRPIITTAAYPANWGSWAFIGGTFNSSTGIYSGGKYVLKNTWTYNATSASIVNTQFSKPVMWIYTIGPAATAPANSASSSASPSSSAAPTSYPTTANASSGSGYGGYG